MYWEKLYDICHSRSAKWLKSLHKQHAFKDQTVWPTEERKNQAGRRRNKIKTMRYLVVWLSLCLAISSNDPCLQSRSHNFYIQQMLPGTSQSFTMLEINFPLACLSSVAWKFVKNRHNSHLLEMEEKKSWSPVDHQPRKLSSSEVSSSTTHTEILPHSCRMFQYCKTKCKVQSLIILILSSSLFIRSICVYIKIYIPIHTCIYIHT